MDRLKTISSTIQSFYGVLALQGVIFIVLAVLILVYPATLIALVAAAFIVIGAALLIASWKVYSFWKKLPELFK